MEHIEMIEKLREKAGITREEAADALTRANWDMLEALVILEREGRIAPLTSSVVSAGGRQYNGGTGAGIPPYAANPGTRGTAGGEGLGSKIKTLFRNSVLYSLMVRRNGKVLVSLPVILFAVILCAAFRLTVLVTLLGLFIGCRYSVEKRDGENGENNEPHSDY